MRQSEGWYVYLLSFFVDYSWLLLFTVDVEGYCGTWSHSDTPYSVGLLWTSDRPVAETSDNIQHSQETEFHSAGGIRTRNPSNREAADPHLRPRGHRNRPLRYWRPETSLYREFLANNYKIIVMAWIFIAAKSETLFLNLCFWYLCTYTRRVYLWLHSYIVTHNFNLNYSIAVYILQTLT